MVNHLKAKIFNRKKAAFSFAQAGEDLVLQRIFLGCRKGCYVDVGAFHPYRFSNTYLFYLQGWRGINIEPRPGSKKIFDSVRPEDINLEIGVAGKSAEMDYRMFAENTLNRLQFDNLQHNGEETCEVVKVRVEPLSAILQQHLGSTATIDFITIDTEGAELEVLLSNNWSDYRMKVVLLEHGKGNNDFAAAAAVLESHGYKEVYRIPVNSQADSVFFKNKEYA